MPTEELASEFAPAALSDDPEPSAFQKVPVVEQS
jgi:hypothetical protein